YRNATVLDPLEKDMELLDIKHRLGNGILGAGLDLPLEAFDFFIKIHRAGINADADRESGRFASRVIPQIQSVVQLVDHVRQTDSVNVEYGCGIRVRPHLRWIARNQK